MDTIKYKGKEYPVVEVEIKEFGERLIATEALENALITRQGVYTDEEAQAIDESIFFFVEDDEIYKSSDEIAEIVFNAL